MGLNNLLVIKPRSRVSDIKKLIDGALSRSAELDPSKIHLCADGDQIKLEGTVGKWLERKAVERAAWAVPGVRHVENHLLVA